VSEYAIVPVVDTTVRRAHLVRRLFRNPLAAAALIFLALVAIVAATGSILAPYDPTRASLQLILASPGPEHWLGADTAGRDVLSRLLVATQISIGAALVALIVAVALGVIGGLLAGYYGGFFDTASSWLTSLVMTLPAVIVLLAARAALGPSVWVSMAIFGVLLSPAFFRLVYASVSAVRHELYVDAARVSGLSDLHIISRHILAVVRAPLIIQAAVILGIAIAVQSGLEFLGLGDISVPTWGSMLNDGFVAIYRAPILMLWPSLAIGLTSMALVLVSNAARDELERTVKRRVGRKLGVSGTPPTEAMAVVGSPLVRTPPTLMPTKALLSVRELEVGYEKEDGSTTRVVRDVSLDINRGEVHGLIGESGSGKTQTAFAIMGLTPAGGKILAGSIRFDGAELANAPERAFREIRGQRIGYIPQEPMSNLDPSFTVGSQLIEPLRLVLGLSKRDATERALSLLERVGIPDPRRTFAAYPHQISGGMAQRVLIAGAVSCDPELLIADEPTTALDVTVQAEVLDLLRDLQQERQLSILIVTHNFGVVADLCDRVSVMQKGAIVETGDVDTVFSNPSHAYTRSLLSAILEGGDARPALEPTKGGA
jgi:ABC-type dipeptide/oligopeptide/nickel transport system ATPase component/ABC-type dipeptide/oligopeptide/nickel transport system permease subunit